jgi:REP element-mobilizing transposase RayT
VGEPKTYYQRHLPHYQPEDATYHVVVRLAGSLPSEVVQELKRERERMLHELDRSKDGDQLKGEREAYQQKYFELFDTLLDGSSVGPKWLQESAIAAIVKKAIHFRDVRQYDLIAYSIMPNHVHLVINVGRVADPTVPAFNNIRDPDGRDSDPTLPAFNNIRNPDGREVDPTLPAFNNIRNPDGRDGVPSYKLTAILASLKKYTALRVNRELNRSGTFWQDESYDRVIRDDQELERTIVYVLQNPVKAGLVNSWEDWQWNYCKFQNCSRCYVAGLPS